MAKSRSYKQGYRAGRSWKWSHVPGGPADMCPVSAVARKEWLAGWHIGVKSSKYKETGPVSKLLAGLASD